MMCSFPCANQPGQSQVTSCGLIFAPIVILILFDGVPPPLPGPWLPGSPIAPKSGGSRSSPLGGSVLRRRIILFELSRSTVTLLNGAHVRFELRRPPSVVGCGSQRPRRRRRRFHQVEHRPIRKPLRHCAPLLSRDAFLDPFEQSDDTHGSCSQVVWGLKPACWCRWLFPFNRKTTPF